METFVLPVGIAEEVLAHAREGYPLEVCGLIAGRQGEGLLAYPAVNVAADPQTQYEVDVDTLARQIEFEDEGLQLAAIYHSHPGSAALPSATDIAQAMYPDAVYIICSLQEASRPVLRAFRIVEDRMWEVGLR